MTAEYVVCLQFLKGQIYLIFLLQIKFQNLLISYPEFEKLYRQYRVRKDGIKTPETPISSSSNSTCGDSKLKSVNTNSSCGGERRKNVVSNRNCLLQSLTEQGDVTAEER